MCEELGRPCLGELFTEVARCDSAELVRRAEFTLGKAIRKGQDEGTVATLSQAVSQARRSEELDKTQFLPTRTSLVSNEEWSGNSAGIKHLSDNVEPEQFEEALAEAPAEGTLTLSVLVGHHWAGEHLGVLMSRGPGVHQRRILEAIEQHGYCIVSPSAMSESGRVAARRAARTLEDAGRVSLASQRVRGAGGSVRPMMVAYAPSEAPSSTIVAGTDGKLYRRPGLPLRRSGEPGSSIGREVTADEFRQLKVEQRENVARIAAMDPEVIRANRQAHGLPPIS